MRDHDYSPAVNFLARFFEGTEHAVEIRALPNEQGTGPNRPLFGRNPDLVLAHCQRWDGAGRAVYFAVATRRGGIARGDRTNCIELPALWVDIDCYKLGITKEEAVAALLSLPIPPGIIVDSGGGIHAYWLLRETIDVSQDDAASWPQTELRVVGALKQLAGVFAGDLAVCDLARIMRLPGTHNTKDGSLRLCVVLECSTWARVDLAELEDMLDVQRPLLAMPLPADKAAGAAEENPFLAAAKALTFQPSVDVRARLDAMQYRGATPNSIHETRCSVSSSLAARGVPDDEILTLLLAETHRAAAEAGVSTYWNWAREEKTILAEIASAERKFAPETRPSSRSSATVIELRGGGAKARPEEATEERAAPPPAKDLPVIRLGGGWLSACIDAAEEALLTTRPQLPLFIYGDKVVRAAPGPIVAAVDHTPTEVLGYRCVPVSAMGLRDLLSRHADFQKWDVRGKRWVSTNCPPDVAEGLLSRTGIWRLPPLRAIIAAPVIRPDLSLLDRAGYDMATGLFYAPGSMLMPALPASPGIDEARAALAVLKHPLRDIPFVDGPSLSVALSAILTGLDRPMLGRVPIHAFDSPQAGSGKGLACNYTSVISIGHEAGAVLAHDDPAETDKTLSAKIIAGHNMILLDNVDHPLRSPLLSQITSEPFVETRILGQSTTVSVQNTFSILINGNNLVLSGDLPRRALKARLDAKVSRPELRVFASENPVEFAKRERGTLVAAGLTVLLAYRLAGMPDQGVPPLSGFEAWHHHVRCALLWAGEADPLATQDHIRAVDKETQSHVKLMAAWLDAISVGVTLGRLAEIAGETGTNPDDAFGAPSRKHPELFDALIDVAAARHGAGDRIDTLRLGQYVSRHVDHTVGDLRIERAGTTKNTVLWVVAKVEHV